VPHKRPVLRFFDELKALFKREWGFPVHKERDLQRGFPVVYRERVLRAPPPFSSRCLSAP
jgi:hypothetical protein